MKTLIIRDLKKTYGSVIAVKDLNLQLNEGEIFVLLGPNGAGKTTTLKLIAGLLKPTHGSIIIKGTDVQSDPFTAKSLISYIPDEPFIYRKLTGREFIHFTAGIRDLDIRDHQQRLEELFKRFEIGNWIDDFSENYSHGMKQKVIMCQLFLLNSDLILIDEPLVGLDPKTSKTVREMFVDLKGAQKTLFISTHTLSFAQDIADRIGIISKGTMMFVGTLGELAEASGQKDIEAIYLKLSEEPNP
ncbi:ABC transporter ATP-binding protein [candidate division WOR-3 bacterium]|nr:ABC transporter ATP-binding protein [candidate division WOR-3 bacterium]